MPFYDPSSIPSVEEVSKAHQNSDVDKSRLSQHHTLGTSATQASPGNHNHDGVTSVKIKVTDLDGSIVATNGLPAGGTAGQILSKIDSTNYNAQWITNNAIQKGDGIFVYIRNNTGSTLTKGQIVYTTGATGAKVTVALAANTSDSTSARTLGWVENDILNNDYGWVQIEGYLSGIDTASVADGSQLYLSATAGGWTATKPVAPNHMVYVGVVAKAASAAGGGAVLVKVQNGYELDELHDVLINGKTNGDLLQYESSTNLWKNKAQSTLSISNTQVSGLGTASTKNIPATGNASATEVVYGTDTRLTDARTPTSHTHGNITNAGLVTTAGTFGATPKLLIADSTTNAVSVYTPTGTASSTTFLAGNGTWATPAGGGSGVPYGPRYLNTGYFYAPIGLVGQGGTSTFTANTLYAIPFYVPATKTAVYLSINISTLNGTSGGIRVGIYSNSTTDDYPNARIVDAGVIPTDTLQATGPNLATISNSLTAGLYWLVAVRQGTSNPTIYSYGSSTVTAQSVLPAGTTAASAYGAVAWTQASVTGALPATFTTTKTLATNAPAVWIGF